VKYRTRRDAFMPEANEPSSLGLVLVRFPEHADTIRRLMHENGEFRGMAADYALSIKMLNPNSKLLCRRGWKVFDVDQKIASVSCGHVLKAPKLAAIRLAA
jgi:hypothetical protein